jgi:TrbL/VirB6 plasmid conjugal transfer protein
MRHTSGLRHFPHRAMLVLAALAVVPGIPHAGHPVASAASAPAAVSAAASSAAARAGLGGATLPALPARAGLGGATPPDPPAEAVDRSAANLPVTAVTVAAREPADQGGICSVPGIGDIGGLLGFCSLGNSGLSGDLNNICQPSVPDPEPAASGIDAMVKPPAAPGKQPATLYGSYGIAGQYWAATGLQCSDMTSLIGNNVASMVFDIAKSIDRVTISVYQSAAGNGILTWLTSVVDKLVSSLGNAIYFPYLAAVVIIGAIWLAWQGLIRKRGTRTIEGTIWMVVACAAAIWLIGRPADFTGAGSAVSDGISQTLNVAFAKLPAPSQSNCLPVSRTDPQIQPSNFDFSSASGVVDQNANELWTVLVCKPWLAGEFGTTAFGPAGGSTPVNTYGRQLLWAQAIAANEKPTTALVKAKQATYSGIATSIQERDPGIFPLFQGKQWTTRLEIAFAALFAAAIAGVLVLLIAVTLILLKLGFLLLLVVGPFFLLIGTHPGFGRVVAMRWFEMLVGVLLKQGAVALVLSVLLYAYSLIMGASDAVLPWALKILMIALVTIAVFIYRRPFQHLFSAVGYGMIGSRERAEIDLERSRATLRANTLAAAAAVPAVAAYRAARWARRHPAQASGLAASADGSGVGSAAAGMPGTAGMQAMDGTSLDREDGYALANGKSAGMAPEGGRARASSGAGLASRARAWAAASVGEGTGRTAPPLNLPPRETAGSAQGGWARSGGAAAGTIPPGRTAAATAAGAAAADGSGRPGQSSARPGPGPARPGQADPVRARPAGPWSARSSGAQEGPVPAGRSPSSPAPASSGSARSAPAGPAPAGPGPAPAPPRPAGAGSPWRRGGTRQPQARPPTSPDPAPGGTAGRGQRGPWADSSAGRQAPPPPRRPASATERRAGAQPSAPQPAAPSARQPARPARQTASAPARQPARPGAAPTRPRGRDTGPPELPLAGSSDADEFAGPAPFWLRPIRRRK